MLSKWINQPSASCLFMSKTRLKNRATGCRDQLPNVLPRSSSYGRQCMAMIQLPPDFKDFLRLLNEKEVEYLLIGGYAVAHYGYIRATSDIGF